jgi:molybdenum cofactor synthesis domain-containing protein
VAAARRAGWHAGGVIEGSVIEGSVIEGSVVEGSVVEQVPIQDALGRVSAAPVFARWASPRFACAAMDGIAVSGRQLGSTLAGGGQVLLPASAFTWVDTGDPVPAGADTVVERERVAPRADGVLVTGPVARGRNVRPVGEDFQAGQPLIPGGRRLRPADLAAAAAAGHSALAVARRPVVTIIPTGDEIRPVGSVLEPGEFTDSNSLMLAARAVQAGALPAVTDVQPDDPDALAAAVRDAALTADLVLVIAGSSRGRGDYTAAVLAQVGAVAIAGVAVRPGHPVLLGHAKTGRSGHVPAGAARASAVPVIGVPGYPLAAAVIFELFAAPLLAELSGSVSPERAPVLARLARDFDSPPDVEEWVPVSLTGAGADAGAGTGAGGGGGGGAASGLSDGPSRRFAEATPGEGHGAGSISRLVRADAWWPIPIGQGRFARGDSIEVLPLGD